jgi:hypothetical protein
MNYLTINMSIKKKTKIVKNATLTDNFLKTMLFYGREINECLDENDNAYDC